MDAWTVLADAASSSFPTVVGYSMYDFVLYAKMLVTQFIAGPIIFVIYNQKWLIAWFVILIIVAFASRLVLFMRRGL